MKIAVFLFRPLARNLRGKSYPTMFRVCFEQFVKNDVDSSSSTSGDPETLAREAQISHLSSSCGKGTATTLPPNNP